MKTCPKCNEVNGENRTDCWKCKALLEKPIEYKKICTKCNLIFDKKAEECEECGSRLSVHSEYINYSNFKPDNGGFWLYLAVILAPAYGFRLGYIYIAEGKSKYGRDIINTSIIASALQIVLLFLFIYLRMIFR